MNTENIENPLPVLIDFGQAWLLERDFNLAASDPAYPYYAPERIEKGDIWREPADIFGLGGILYFLAVGEDPPPVFSQHGDTDSGIEHKDHSILKYELLEKIRTLNPGLYNENPGIVDIVLYCLRPDVNERASYAEAVLDVVELFEGAFRTSEDDVDSNSENIIDKLSEKITELDELVQLLQTTDIHLFPRILKRDIRVINTQIRTVKSRIYNLEGDRETFINGLLACISMLAPGDQLLALTTPTFWRKYNFGNYGRLLTMIKMAAVHGIRIKWVLLLSQDEFQNSEIQEILAAQSHVMQELLGSGINVGQNPQNSAAYYVGYVVVDPETRKSVARQSKTFILTNRISQDQNTYTLINPRYNRSEGRVTIVRFWNDPNRLNEFLTDLEDYFQSSTSLLSSDLSSTSSQHGT